MNLWWEKEKWLPLGGRGKDWRGAWENFLGDGNIVGLDRGWGYYMDLLNSLNCTLHIFTIIYIKFNMC